MAEPVIAAELAETLRALLVASKRDRDASDNALCLLPEQDTEWPEGYDFEALEAAHEEEIAARQSLRKRHTATESLLASYDAQQSNPSPVLVPTHNCSMADTGDFDECCIVCGESTDGGHPPERCVKNIESATFQAIEFEQGFLKARKESINPSLAEELLRTKDELAKVVKAYDSAMVRLSEEVSRRTALNREDRIPGPSKRALSEVEKAAVNVVNAHDVVVRLSHRTVRGIEASVECDKTIEALRDALKRIGAL